MQKKSEQAEKGEHVIADSIPPKKSCRKTWAALIKKIYEVDPLCCPRCSHLMRIISIIDQPETIIKILRHLDLWHPQAHGPPLNKKEKKMVEETVCDYSFFDYLPA